MASTTAVTIFHPAQDAAGFDAWVAELRASARADGAVATSVSIHDEPDLDWAFAATFSSEQRLHDWLDSAGRRSILEAGQARGFWSRAADLVLSDGSEAPPGVSAFRHDVAAGKEADFLAVQARLVAVSSRFPGYEGTVLLPADSGGEWLSVLRFRTAAQLSAWLESHERDEALPGLRSSLTKGFSDVSSTTPFGTTVRVKDGRTLMTPNWKSAMMVLLVLYPTVMILSRFVGPVLDGWGAQPWLALWLSQVISVSLLQWWLMPGVSRWFGRWLDPLDGAGLRTSAAGAAVIVALYLVTLTAFATVTWLQYWDFAD